MCRKYLQQKEETLRSLFFPSIKPFIHFSCNKVIQVWWSSKWLQKTWNYVEMCRISPSLSGFPKVLETTTFFKLWPAGSVCPSDASFLLLLPFWPEKVFTLPFPFCQGALSYTSSLVAFPQDHTDPGEMFLLAQTLLKAGTEPYNSSETPRSWTCRSRPIVRNKQPLKRCHIMNTQRLQQSHAAWKSHGAPPGCSLHNFGKQNNGKFHLLL